MFTDEDPGKSGSSTPVDNTKYGNIGLTIALSGVAIAVAGVILMNKGLRKPIASQRISLVAPNSNSIGLAYNF